MSNEQVGLWKREGEEGEREREIVQGEKNKRIYELFVRSTYVHTVLETLEVTQEGPGIVPLNLPRKIGRRRSRGGGRLLDLLRVGAGNRLPNELNRKLIGNNNEALASPGPERNKRCGKKKKKFTRVLDAVVVKGTKNAYLRFSFEAVLAARLAEEVDGDRLGAKVSRKGEAELAVSGEPDETAEDGERGERGETGETGETGEVGEEDEAFEVVRLSDDGGEGARAAKEKKKYHWKEIRKYTPTF